MSPTRSIARPSHQQASAAWQRWTQKNTSTASRPRAIRRQVPWLESNPVLFPPIDEALPEPNGLLAAGGDLSSDTLVDAYRHGIFPWFEDGQPILWWSPDPRSVLFPDSLKISRSLGKVLRQQRFSVTADQAFEAVIDACQQPRSYTHETWITTEMQDAYIQLHHLGIAHSVECWQEDKLVGGLYGLAMGKLFFGESMFHRATDASKVAFAYLCRLCLDHGYPLIDCQIENSHLTSLGATNLPREVFRSYLVRFVDDPEPIDWRGLTNPLPSW